MTDAAPRILSAISTVLGPSLSPPVFGCHGDDVKLHHRLSPVDGLRGGATNPGHSACRNHHPVRFSAAQVPISCSIVLASRSPKCAKLCICKPVSAETRSEPRYPSRFCFSLLGFASRGDLCILSCHGGTDILNGLVIDILCSAQVSFIYATNTTIRFNNYTPSYLLIFLLFCPVL